MNDPFGIEKGWELNNKAPKEKKRNYLATVGAGTLSAYGGGVAYGVHAGRKANEKSYADIITGRPLTGKRVLHNIGEGYKAAAKTKTGKVAIGAVAAGTAVNAAAARKAKREGTIIRKAYSKRTQNAMDTGAMAGFAAGGYGGYKAVKAGHRIKDASAAMKGYHGLNRAVGNSRIGAATSTLRAAPSMLKAPKKPATLGALGAGYVGAISGSVMGSNAGKRWAKNHPKNVKKNMSVSAFGVDHGSEFSKAQYRPNKKKPTTGRLVAGGVFGPLHGLVAGKGAGGKARSAGTQLAGTWGGGIGGAAAGTLAGRGNPLATSVGSAAGATGGAVAGTKIAHKKGWLKRQ